MGRPAVVARPSRALAASGAKATLPSARDHPGPIRGEAEPPSFFPWARFGTCATRPKSRSCCARSGPGPPRKTLNELPRDNHRAAFRCAALLFLERRALCAGSRINCFERLGSAQATRPLAFSLPSRLPSTRRGRAAASFALASTLPILHFS